IPSGGRTGSSATSLAPSFTVPGPTLHDTASVDFLGGTRGPNTYVSETSNGEVILAPTVGTEFSGSSLEPGWLAAPWDSNLPPQGRAIVDGGVLTVDGAIVGTCDAAATPTCEPGIHGRGYSPPFVQN